MPRSSRAAADGSIPAWSTTPSGPLEHGDFDQARQRLERPRSTARSPAILMTPQPTPKPLPSARAEARALGSQVKDADQAAAGRCRSRRPRKRPRRARAAPASRRNARRPSRSSPPRSLLFHPRHPGRRRHKLRTLSTAPADHDTGGRGPAQRGGGPRDRHAANQGAGRAGTRLADALPRSLGPPDGGEEAA